MGSFSRTAEQKAAPHLAKGKKTNKRDKGKKYCTMVGFQLKAAALLAVLATSQCLANDESPISSSQSAAQVSHSTFYVSYFNTALIFFLIILLMVEVFFNPFEHVANPFGSSKSIFEFVACWKAPDTSIGNHGGSYLTF